MPIRRLPTTSQAPVFLLNSRLGRFSAARFGSPPHGRVTYHGHPFSRSYGAILPSSFSTTHSSTLGSSPRLPVSVCGTVGEEDSRTRLFSAASLEGPLRRITPPSGSGLTSSRRGLPPRPGYTVPSGPPTPDGPSASASPLAVRRPPLRHGTVRPFPIACASRPRLRGRLTRSG